MVTGFALTKSEFMKGPKWVGIYRWRLSQVGSAFSLFTIFCSLTRVDAVNRLLPGGKEASPWVGLSVAFVLSMTPAFSRHYVSKTAPLS